MSGNISHRGIHLLKIYRYATHVIMNCQSIKQYPITVNQPCQTTSRSIIYSEFGILSQNFFLKKKTSFYSHCHSLTDTCSLGGTNSILYWNNWFSKIKFSFSSLYHTPVCRPKLWSRLFDNAVFETNTNCQDYMHLTRWSVFI